MLQRHHQLVEMEKVERAQTPSSKCIFFFPLTEEQMGGKKFYQTIGQALELYWSWLQILSLGVFCH